MHSVDSIMVFAAGKGTRMGDLTANQPKPMIKVGGRRLLDRTLDVVDHAGVQNVVVNTHYFGESIHNHLRDRDVTCVHEPDLLETGGGLRNALPSLGSSPVLTLNSDAVWTGKNPITTLRMTWDPKKMDALLLLVPRANAGGYGGNGDFILDDDGRIARGAGAVYTGAQIIRTDGLAAISEPAFSLNILWDKMFKDGRVYGVLHDGGWCDVGHPAGIKIAEDMIAETADV